MDTEQAPAEAGIEVATDAIAPVADAPEAPPVSDVPLVEQLAAKAGWSPQEQWRGNPEDWKDAATFLEGTIAIQRTQSKELRGLRDTVADVGRVTAQLLADQLAAKDAEWEARFNEAVEAGDVAAAKRATDERDRLRASAPPATLPPDVRDFAERNATWFQKHPLATQRAIEIADAFARAGYGAAEQVTEVEKQIRKEYPELFAAPATPAKPQPGVASASRSVDTSNRKASFADMPKVHQELARQLHEERGVPLEKYFESWKKNNQEKVG